MGLLTKINDANNPFHRASSPSVLIRVLPASIIVTPFSACFVFNTQKGLVAKAEMHPAELELFVMLRNDVESKPNIFLACA